MGCVVQTLSTDLSIPLLHLSFLLPSLEQALSVPVVKELLILLARPETMVLVAVILLVGFVLELEFYCLIVPSTSSLLFYSLSNSYSILLLYCTIAQRSWVAILTPWVFSIWFHLYLSWISLLKISFHIHFLLLFFWTFEWILLLFFLSALFFFILLL